MEMCSLLVRDNLFLLGLLLLKIGSLIEQGSSLVSVKPFSSVAYSVGLAFGLKM